MEKVKKHEIDMCNGPILKKVLIFALPLMCSSILQLLFNAADIVVVGKFAGDDALAAVGSNGSIINLLVNVFVGLSIGANVLVSRYYGAKKKEELKSTVHTAIAISIVSGIFLTIVGVAVAEWVLILMNAPKEVIGLATLYLRIYFLGMTSTMVYNFGSAILRAVGDTKRPMYYLLFAGVVNVVLNLIFVIPLKMSVAGVAIATIISQTISAVLVVRCLVKDEGDLKLDFKKIRIDWDKFIKIVKIGIPAGIQGMVFSLSNVVIQSTVNSFGNIVVAGNTAAQNIEGFVYVSMNAFYQAAISFTSQNMGAGNYNRIRKIAVRCWSCVFCIGVALGWCILFLGKPLLSIYTDNPKVMDAGIARLQVIAFTYALCGMMDVTVGLLRGMGHSVVPMLVSIVGACGLRLLWIATVFQMDKFHSITTVYFSYPMSWGITLVAHIITFLLVERKLRKCQN